MAKIGDSPEISEAADAASIQVVEHRITRRLALGAVAGLAATQAELAAGATRNPREQPGSGAPARSAQYRESADSTVSPDQYGAAGNGVIDDTVALQTALDTGHSVRLTPGKSYLLTSRLTLSANGVSLTGGGTIKIAPDFRLSADADRNGTHMRALYVTGANVAIDGVVFDATDAPAGSAVENGFIWSTAPFTAVRGCRFIGLRKGTCVWALGDAPYPSVTGCQFLDCSGAALAKGRNPIISDNIVINATDAAIVLNGRSCVGAVVANNSISNERLAAIPSMIAVEEGAADWAIIGNTLLGVSGGGIICTNVLDFTTVRGGVIADNVINGRNFAGTLPKIPTPAALLSISSCYTDWIVHDNRISGCPAGNSNSRLAVIPATGGSFHDNIVDGSATSGLSALVGISPGAGGLTIKDNKTAASKGARHYLFGPGTYGETPCAFVGGKLYGGAEGINSEFHSGKIVGLAIHIINISDSSVLTFINAATILGDRASFLNAGAWARPHHLGTFTEMYCNGMPRNAGSMPFKRGDKFYYMDPGHLGHIGIVMTDTAVWKNFGAIT